MADRILIKNAAAIVTCDGDDTVFRDCDLLIEGPAIQAIGPNLSVADAEVIHAENCFIYPGLVNTHCHAGDSLFRGLIEDLALEPWLQQVWKAERAILSPETSRLGATLGFAELLLAGVTTVMDVFWYPAEVAKAAGAVGIRVATGQTFIDGPGMDAVKLVGDL